ncbi:MFS transporter [Pseudoalteromonas phenolica]|uniref:MFS transporter n=1 Tax=Pseudoalteromonas phenolica TaxID=161398 RepID=UPI00110A8DCF|nr:MFS transporter [Pseudoalteromonas phenolica]TMN88266.1 MFS transporter [Pseudoalteromonas phenolica]
MSLFKLLLCSVCTFIVLYAPQPLLPIFSELYDVSIANSGALMTVTMLPLAIAPLCYGVMLSQFNPLSILRIALLILAASNLLFAYSDYFSGLLICRLIQGLTVPAALIGMTSYIGTTFQGDALQRNMTLYIGSSIIGGYLGRMLAANFAAFWQWQNFFYLVSVSLVVLALIIPKQVKSEERTKLKIKPWLHLAHLLDIILLRLFVAVFFMFFCFAALLNFLPFIVQNQYGISDNEEIGFIYTGYLVGAILSVCTPWLNKKIKNAWALLSLIFVLYCVSHIMLASHTLSLFIVSFTLFCGCMFVIHATAAPLANKISAAPASVTNGAYVSFYYSGGALGSFLPGFIFEEYGYIAFLACLLVCCLLGLTACLANYKQGTSMT